MSRARWWSASRSIEACGSRRWSRRAIRCMRSIRWRWPAIATATTWPAPSPTRVTPRCWPTWFAPIATTIARSPVTALTRKRVKVLARGHQNLIWARTRHTNQLRNSLREYYPAALEAFDDLADRDCAGRAGRGSRPPPRSRAHRSAQLAADPQTRRTPTQPRPARRRDPGRATRRPARRARPRRPKRSRRPPPRRSGSSANSTARSPNSSTTLADRFEQHPDADIYLSLPGLGDVLGARVLGEFGDDPDRYATPKSRKQLRRHVTHHRRLGQETGRARPPRPQPAPLRRHRPLGLLLALQQPRLPRLLRPTPSRRRPTPPSPPRPRQPTSSASSTAASAPTPSTTNTPPGDTANNQPTTSPLDHIRPWGV